MFLNSLSQTQKDGKSHVSWKWLEDLHANAEKLSYEEDLMLCHIIMEKKVAGEKLRLQWFQDHISGRFPRLAHIPATVLCNRYNDSLRRKLRISVLFCGDRDASLYWLKELHGVAEPNKEEVLNNETVCKLARVPVDTALGIELPLKQAQQHNAKTDGRRRVKRSHDWLDDLDELDYLHMKRKKENMFIKINLDSFSDAIIETPEGFDGVELFVKFGLSEADAVILNQAISLCILYRTFDLHLKVDHDMLHLASDPTKLAFRQDAITYDGQELALCYPWKRDKNSLFTYDEDYDLCSLVERKGAMGLKLQMDFFEAAIIAGEICIGKTADQCTTRYNETLKDKHARAVEQNFFTGKVSWKWLYKIHRANARLHARIYSKSGYDKDKKQKLFVKSKK